MGTTVRTLVLVVAVLVVSLSVFSVAGLALVGGQSSCTAEGKYSCSYDSGHYVFLKCQRNFLNTLAWLTSNNIAQYTTDDIYSCRDDCYGIFPSDCIEPLPPPPSQGSSCNFQGKYLCATSGSKFPIVKCDTNFLGTVSWVATSDSSFTTRETCRTSCQSKYGSSCIEPSPIQAPTTSGGSLSISANPTAPKVGDKITFTSTTSLPTSDIQSHVIQWKIYNGGTQAGTTQSISCSTSFTACNSGASQLVTQSYAAGYVIQYWSTLVKKDGTQISSGLQSVTLSAAGGTTPPGGTNNCGNGRIDPGEDCDGTNLNGQTCESISGGGYTGTLQCYPASDANKCLLNYDGCTSTGGSQVASSTYNPVTFSVNPPSPSTNSQFNIKFTLSSPAPTGSSVQFVLDTTRFASCVGTVCGANVAVSIPGTYTISPVLITGSTQTILSPTYDVIIGSVSSSTSTNQPNLCCVNDLTTPYDYDVPNAEGKCDRGKLVRQSCSQADNTACSAYCTQQKYSGGGCVPSFSFNTDTSGTFPNICNNGEACKCGTQDSNQLRLSQSCEQACAYSSPYGSYSAGYATNYGTGTALSIPQGICTDNPNSLGLLISAGGVIGGTATAGQVGTTRPYPVQPVQPGAYQCGPTETCWCVTLNINTASAQQQQQLKLPAVVPGTGCTPIHGWCDPKSLDNPPKYDSSQHDCNAAVNATITASFGTASAAGTNQAQITGLKLIQAGEPITIIGTVTKTTDQCLGYKYTCEKTQEMQCNLNNTFYWTTLSYKYCPAGMKQIHAEGKGRHANTEAIIGTVIAGASLGFGSGIGAVIAGKGAAGTAFQAGVSLAADGLRRGSQCANGNPPPSAAGVYDQLLTQATRNINGNSGGPTAPGQSVACCSSGADKYFCDDGKGGGVCRDAQTGCPNGYTTFVCGNGLPPDTSSSSSCVAPEQCYIGTGVSVCPLGGSGNSCSNGYGICCRPPPDTTTAAAATAKPTFDITGKITAAQASPYTAIALSLIGESLPVCPSAADILGCFSVCGKEYTSQVSNAPSCSAGGPVIHADPTNYKCGQDSCGGFEGKAVRIQIIGPDGSTVKDETTTAGADGEFSYTFTAPAADGEFTAVVSVPKS